MSSRRTKSWSTASSHPAESDDSAEAKMWLPHQRGVKQSKGEVNEYILSRAGYSACSSVGTATWQSPDLLFHRGQQHPTNVGGRRAHQRAAKQNTATVESSTVSTRLAPATGPIVAEPFITKMATIMWYAAILIMRARQVAMATQRPWVSAPAECNSAEAAQ